MPRVDLPLPHRVVLLSHGHGHGHGHGRTSIAPAQPLRWRILGASTRHLVGNILVASTFFGAALLNVRHFEYAPANFIWVSGATIMGGMSLLRFPPRAAMMNANAFASTARLWVYPDRAGVGGDRRIDCNRDGSLGPGALGGSATLYGRSFGILPGNRGIVKEDPFRIVRHPIYAGWFLLTVGYFLAYPSWINFLIISTAPR
jgi:hypothetical protein